MKYNYKTNRNSLFFLFFFFIFSTPAISQLSCGEVTFNNTNQDPFSNRAAISQQSLQDSYCVKIYMHVIRDFNGNGGQPISKVNSAFEKLNLDFNPLNIFFEWDDEIDYIDDAGYFNNTHILILEKIIIIMVLIFIYFQMRRLHGVVVLKVLEYHLHCL